MDKPLNFAEALKLKPQKAEEGWKPGLPKLEPQPPTQESQPPGDVDSQYDPEVESKYPSRVYRRKKSIRLPIHKLEKYEAYCFLNKLDFQDAVERALDALISGRLDSHILIDEKEDKQIDEVLIYYRKVTGNRVTKKDEEARAEVQGYSVTACKIGIAMSVIRSKVKINSFRYCIGAIEEAAEAPFQDGENYLKFLENSLRRKE